MKKYPNIVRCKQCGIILVSNDRHDYKTCSCPNKTMVDGGYDYLRAGGVDLAKVEVLRVCRKFTLTPRQ